MTYGLASPIAFKEHRAHGEPQRAQSLNAYAINIRLLFS